MNAEFVRSALEQDTKTTTLKTVVYVLLAYNRTAVEDFKHLSVHSVPNLNNISSSAPLPLLGECLGIVGRILTVLIGKVRHFPVSHP